MTGRPYLYQFGNSFSRSHEHSLLIARKELHNAGFELFSKPADWHQFAVNADTLLVVGNVPLSPTKTHVHVVSTSNTDASAKKWAADLMTRIEKSKTVMID